MRDRIICGDTLDFVTTFAGYPAATWTCTYYLVPRTAGSGSAFSIVCTAGTEANEHRCAAAAATTGAWTPAEYSWFARVTSGSESYSGEAWPWRGECTILPNPATTTNYDSRSDARKALDAMNAFIAGSTDMSVKRYTINGRELERWPLKDLLVARQRLAAEVANEDICAKLNAGLGGGRKIQVRL